MASKSPSIFQLKISLIGTKPPIWRRILVPNTFTFRNLHGAIQDSMGWRDNHAHCFQIHDLTIGNPFGDDVQSGKSVKISDHLIDVGCKVTYVYDLGDNWYHKVELENIIEEQEGVEYPVCVGGRRACPPEDCGGPCGFHFLLIKLADPNDEEHEEMKEWMQDNYPNGFNAAQFDPKAVEFRHFKKELGQSQEF